MSSGQHSFGEIGKNAAISPAQCRAARALLELSRSDLAKAASVAERTIADFESQARTPIRATLAALRRALEMAGVEFLADSGVKLRREAEESTKPTGTSGSGSDQDAERGTLKPARSPKPAAPTRKAEPAASLSKLDQIRALREQGAR